MNASAVFSVVVLAALAAAGWYAIVQPLLTELSTALQLR